MGLLGGTTDFSVITIAIILFVMIRLFSRMLKNKNGSVYSIKAIFITPVIYIILSIYFTIGLGILQNLTLLIILVVGSLVGLFLGKRSDIFEKEGKVMYRRSIEVMIIWMIGFIIRIGVDLILNPILNGSIPSNAIATFASSPIYIAYESSAIVFGADIILVFSAGILLGEAFVLYKNHRSKYKV